MQISNICFKILYFNRMFVWFPAHFVCLAKGAGLGSLQSREKDIPMKYVVTG